MSALAVIVGHRTIRLWTALDASECSRRLAGNPDLPFTTSEIAPGKFSVVKKIPRAWRHARRQEPPIVHAELVLAERGTSVVVEGRMSYRQLAGVVFISLFLCVAVGGVLIVPSIQNGRPLSDLTPVFVFLLGFVALNYVSSLLGAISGTRRLAQHLAAVLQAGPAATIR
jgi:hypothetical protein